MEKMEIQNDYWGFCLNRLDVIRLSGVRPEWQWTGLPSHKPGGRIADWLDILIGSDYIPKVDEITRYSPDIGTELERFDMAINTAYGHQFVRKFGISVEGVLFTLTLNDTVTLKETT